MVSVALAVFLAHLATRCVRLYHVEAAERGGAHLFARREFMHCDVADVAVCRRGLERTTRQLRSFTALDEGDSLDVRGVLSPIKEVSRATTALVSMRTALRSFSKCVCAHTCACVAGDVLLLLVLLSAVHSGGRLCCASLTVAVAEAPSCAVLCCAPLSSGKLTVCGSVFSPFCR